MNKYILWNLFTCSTSKKNYILRIDLIFSWCEISNTLSHATRNGWMVHAKNKL